MVYDPCHPTLTIRDGAEHVHAWMLKWVLDGDVAVLLFVPRGSRLVVQVIVGGGRPAHEHGHLASGLG